jgi:hypothetical protein
MPSCHHVGLQLHSRPRPMIFLALMGGLPGAQRHVEVAGHEPSYSHPGTARGPPCITNHDGVHIDSGIFTTLGSRSPCRTTFSPGPPLAAAVLTAWAMEVASACSTRLRHIAVLVGIGSPMKRCQIHCLVSRPLLTQHLHNSTMSSEVTRLSRRPRCVDRQRCQAHMGMWPTLCPAMSR